MNQRNIIILLKDSQAEAWGSLTEICKVHQLPYWKLKEMKFPFQYDGYEFVKVPFRERQIINNKQTQS